jgi:hypothetical protein
MRAQRRPWSRSDCRTVVSPAEFCPVYFGAELLAGTGLRTAQAATAMSGFYLGILAGRPIPSHDPRDTLHWHPVSAGPILAGESHECRVAGHGVSQALVFQLG